MNTRIWRWLAIGAVVVAALALVVPAGAAPGSTSLNARATRWQESDAAIHVVVFADAGRPGYGPAVITEGETVILLFEWTDETLDILYDSFINDPTHTITLLVDGGPAFSVKDGYQTPFMAATRSGPRWSWDHDGDGPGDGDGDGIGDWVGPTLFWRYAVGGLSVGTHTLELEIMSGGVLTAETLTVEVVP